MKLLKIKSRDVVSGIRTGVHIADVFAQCAPIWELQSITKTACKIVEHCESMQDNKKQAIDLAGHASNIRNVLDECVDSTLEECADEGFRRGLINLAEVLRAATSKLKRFINVQSHAKTLKRYSEQLKDALDVFQIRNSLGLRGDLARSRSDTKATLHMVQFVGEYHSNEQLAAGLDNFGVPRSEEMNSRQAKNGIYQGTVLSRPLDNEFEHMYQILQTRRHSQPVVDVIVVKYR
ncbi:hypothetical protein CERSUDRAFT_73158 [Gelatoporia subvermispora B]|uniref:Fungal N-terminal domain-containing protein n=1 Tax=Ceriporiopsis subvermispora (strain B) TaxID=914234 RepID=M2PLK1_CERS8|nr:hypothetical protein CERSUDRAFT_73158 [Gelatoporia subvermispora B]